jgi:NADPH:quinone reductase-like Zn-dependent oxidoreductase
MRDSAALCDRVFLRIPALDGKHATMKLRYKIGLTLLTLVAISLAGLAIALSYEAECGPAPALADNARTMQAIRYRCYGSPDVLKVEDVEVPAVGDDDVLVRVHAAAANPLDWHFMRGEPYIMRLMSGLGAPTDSRLGVDFAGMVEAVGRNVSRFSPGDPVFGGVTGAYGEYVRLRQDRAIVRKPDNLSFEQAAAVGIAGVTALQGLRDKGRIQPGQKVLINGASGGVGTFAVQIAKALGAEVTGVCSTRNVELVRSLGADHVIDYTQENFTESGVQYDLILDNQGNHSLSDTRRAMTPNGILVMVGGESDGNFIGPLKGPLMAMLQGPFVSQQMKNFLAELRQADLEILAGMMESGQVTPVIDRRYPLAQVSEAIRYLETGRARGKVIINVP